MNSILMPIDGSTLSWQVVSALGSGLLETPAKLTLLRVAQDLGELDASLPAPMSWSLSDLACDHWDDALKGHTAYLTEEWRALRNEVPTISKWMRTLAAAGYATHFTVIFGRPSETIVRTAHEGNYEALAMATHGRTGLRRMVLGSVTEQVLRRLHIPVLVLRPTEKDTA